MENQKQQEGQSPRDLQEGEATRITIVEYTNGEIAIGVNATSKIDTLRLVGMMEIAKLQLMDDQKNGVDKNQVTEIELDELDFEMDHMGMLTKQGKVVGDKVPFPDSLVELRDISRAEFLKQKQANTEGQDNQPTATEPATETIEEAAQPEEVATETTPEVVEEVAEEAPQPEAEQPVEEAPIVEEVVAEPEAPVTETIAYEDQVAASQDTETFQPDADGNYTDQQEK